MSSAFRVSLLSLALSLSLISPVFSQSQSSASPPTVAQAPAEPDLRGVVEKYFALYAGKDLDGLSGLWSENSPDYAALRQNLQREFAAEDYRFSPPTISRLKVEGERAGLRATVKLTATDLKSGRQREQQVTRNFSLVRENGAWKVWRAALAENDLAKALVKAGSEAERAGLLAEEKELMTTGLVRALINQGNLFVNQSDYAQATAVYRLAQSIAEQIGDQAGIAHTTNNIGGVYFLQGNYTQAAVAYRLAQSIAEQFGEKAGIARAITNIGAIHMVQGDYAQAVECYQRSLAISEDLGDRGIIARTLGNIGVVNFSQGNYAQALAYYQKSVEMFQVLRDRAMAARALGNIGNVFDSQGNYAQALEHHQKSLAMLESLGDKAGIAGTLHNIGSIHIQREDYVQALEYYQKSLGISEAVDYKSGIADTLNGIGVSHHRQGNYMQALEYYEKSLAMSDLLGDKAGIAYSLNSIGNVYKKQGRDAQALEFAERAAILAQQIGRIETFWQARFLAGTAYRALNQPAQARQAFDEAIRTIETMRVQIAGGEQEQQRFFESKVSPYHAMVELLIAQNNTAEALTYAERARARALLDVLYSGRANVTKAMTGQEQEQERKLNNQLISLNTQISRESLRPQPDQARLAELKSQLQKARLEFEAFQTALYAAHPELRVQRGEAPVMTAGEIAALLPDTTSALLEYVVTDSVTYLFAVTKAQSKSAAKVQVFTLPVKRDELIRQTEGLRRQLAARDLGFRASAAKLYELLLKPAEAQLRGKTNLIIAPDDKLWELPFQALLTGANRFLIESAAIAYTPSLTVLREMAKRRMNQRADAASGALLALGNPLLGKETIEKAALALRDEKLDSLPEAEKEVKALGQLYGSARSQVYIGAEAREDRLKAEAAQARVLHFATHGILNNASPMYSHLALARGDKSEDGLLEAWELMQLDLKADLAVLSACETARGRFGAGEGMIGLSWALFVAGVPSTVVSQWKVESASTRDLMLNFHRQLRPPSAPAKARATKAGALRQAALKLMKSPATSHPFYWAGFVLVGDGR